MSLLHHELSDIDDYQFADGRHAVEFLLNIAQMFLQIVFRTLLQQLSSEHSVNATTRGHLIDFKLKKTWVYIEKY